MHFDGAHGTLLGQEHRGLMAMFTLINKSRLGAAVQAQAQAGGSHQISLAYAKERIQGRSPRSDGKSGADAIIDHPDVQRMLNLQRVISEGSRSLIHGGLKQLDIAQWGDESVAAAAERKLSLMTPILKGCISEWGCEAADLGIQILGGHGYTQDWGAEQRLRDVRVTRIYEGTTGIQAQDFLLRKMLPDVEGAFNLLYKDIDKLSATLTLNGEVKAGILRLQSLVSELRLVTNLLAERATANDGVAEEVAYDYLMISGYILLANQWIVIAKTAHKILQDQNSDGDYLKNKMDIATICFKFMLPRAQGHLAVIKEHLPR